ncbi:helix-turn-helix domain-containing protein [Candidatus Kapabacteria bacterium]|nr:helix-turn-helix domain-containing protein [Candidatus Kapabacteria bacterium]
MKHVSIILPIGSCIVDTIIAPYNLLRMANSFYKKKVNSTEDFWTVDIVGLTKDPVTYHKLISLKPTKTIDEIKKTDLIIVSSIDGDLIKQIDKNTLFIDWIKNQRSNHNTDIASLCKGAFLLAETGLLNGKACATHWTAQNLFKLRYPEVHLVPEKIICEDNGIYSSGGAYSFLNFTLFLIEKYFGRETAIWISKISEIDFDRDKQSQFMIFQGQREHDDKQIKQAQDIIEENYSNKISIEEIANMVYLNQRSFLRRFKKATDNTPIEYLQRVKVESAKKKLELTTLTISEIMYGIGYNDEKAFRKTFRKYSGLSPKEYRLKFSIKNTTS